MDPSACPLSEADSSSSRIVKLRLPANPTPFGRIPEEDPAELPKLTVSATTSYSTAIMTSVDLIIAVAGWPTSRCRRSTEPFVIEATTSSPPGRRITTIDITAPSSIDEMTPASWFLALICTPQRTTVRCNDAARPGATQGAHRLHN